MQQGGGDPARTMASRRHSKPRMRAVSNVTLGRGSCSVVRTPPHSVIGEPRPRGRGDSVPRPRKHGVLIESAGPPRQQHWFHRKHDACADERNLPHPCGKWVTEISNWIRGEGDRRHQQPSDQIPVHTITSDSAENQATHDHHKYRRQIFAEEMEARNWVKSQDDESEPGHQLPSNPTLDDVEDQK